jgi:hypothetical protein
MYTTSQQVLGLPNTIHINVCKKSERTTSRRLTISGIGGTQSKHSTTTLFHALATLHTSAMQQYTTTSPFHNDDLQSPFCDLQQLDSIQQFKSLCQRASTTPPLHAQQDSNNDSLLFTAYRSRL